MWLDQESSEETTNTKMLKQLNHLQQYTVLKSTGEAGVVGVPTTRQHFSQSIFSWLE